MYRKLAVCLGFLLFLAALACDVSGQDSRRVGRFGDLSRVVIRGLRTFAPDDVRDKLKWNSAAIMAAHRLAPLDKFPVVIRQQLLAGFWRSGFVDATVQTEIDYDHSRLIATIIEGPRFLSGAVRVEGSKQIDVDLLKRRLAQRFPADGALIPVFNEKVPGRVDRWLDKDGGRVKWSDPSWVKNQPAKTDSLSRVQYAKQIRRSLEELGFRDTLFDVSLEPNRETRRVDLVVQIHDEGRLARLTQIEVHGNQRDSDEAILNYLKLSPRAAISRQREMQLWYDLWHSGRFVSTKVELQTLQESSGRVLVLTVKDSPYAPPIGQSLSKEERTLMKMGRWMSDFGGKKAWRSDLVMRMRFERTDVTAIISKRDGVLVTFRPPDRPSARSATLVASRHELACYPPVGSVYLRAKKPDLELTANLAIRLSDTPDTFSTMRLGFGMGIPVDGKETPPLAIGLGVTPAYCLAVAHARSAKLTWEGDRLIVNSDKDHYEIDSRDGRLIAFRSQPPNNDFSMSFVENAFTKALQATHLAATESENVFQAKHPLRSTFNFLYHEQILDDQLTRRDRDSFHVWSKFVSMGLLDPIDEWFANLSPADDSQESFKIPYSGPALSGDWIEPLAIAMIPLANRLFPRESWTWTLWRETGFAISGQGEYFFPQLKQVYESRNFGPIGMLAVANFLEDSAITVNRGVSAAQAFAQNGLGRLTLDDFRQDYRPLLDRGQIAGRCVLRACEIIRHLDEREMNEFSASLAKQWRAPFAAFAGQLRRDTNRKTEEAAAAALDAAWKTGLRVEVEKMLNDLRNRSKPSDRP